MHTLRLKIQDSVYVKIVSLLDNFNTDEVEVIDDTEEFLAAKEYLQKELDEIENGNANFIGYNEMESRLEQVIKKNENRI